LELTMVYLVALALTLLGSIAVILAHELGHLLVARLCQVPVTGVCIGLGPKILQFRYRDLQWSVAALPIGGYIAFEERSPHARDKSRFRRSLARRALILVAGPGANFLVALILIIAAVTVPVDVFQTTGVHVVKLSGGKPVSINLSVIACPLDRRAVAGTSEDGRHLCVSQSGSVVGAQRDGRPFIDDASDQLGGAEPLINENAASHLTLASRPLAPAPLNFVEAIAMGINATWSLVTLAPRQFGYLLGLLPAADIDDMASPLNPISKLAALGDISFLLYLFGAFSILMGSFNLLPVHPLDGGQLVLCAIEACCGRPIMAPVRQYLARLGYVLMFLLALLAAWNVALHASA
jgi:regulator of sigma E protease